jgi:D-sedoheptulose 7-phosphate isomerase
MSEISHAAAGLQELSRLAAETAADLTALEPIISAMRSCLETDGTLFFAGNGGSAADAQHLATEYVVRYHASQQRAFRAVALTTDSSILTAAGNDFGFDQVFARQLAALGRTGDLLILHSTSGNSPNLLRAAEQARASGIISVALLGGDGGKLAGLVDHGFVVASDRPNHIQEIHLALQHQIAAILTGDTGQ